MSTVPGEGRAAALSIQPYPLADLEGLSHEGAVLLLRHADVRQDGALAEVVHGLARHDEGNVVGLRQPGAVRGQTHRVLEDHALQSFDVRLIIVRYTADLTADDDTMMAIAVIAALPVFVLFFSMFKYFLQGAGVYSGSKT